MVRGKRMLGNISPLADRWNGFGYQHFYTNDASLAENESREMSSCISRRQEYMKFLYDDLKRATDLCDHKFHFEEDVVDERITAELHEFVGEIFQKTEVQLD